MAARLDTLWFSVKDMAQAKAFYVDVLGLVASYESEYWTSLAIEGGAIGLHGPSDPERSVPQGGWVLGVAVDDLRRTAAVLKRVACDFKLYETPRGALLDFCDPEGNRVQALQIGTKAADFPDLA